MKRIESVPARIGEIKIQVDRWPTVSLGDSDDADESKTYVLTIICVAIYDKKPDHKTILKAVSDSLEILKATP